MPLESQEKPMGQDEMILKEHQDLTEELQCVFGVDDKTARVMAWGKMLRTEVEQGGRIKL